MILVEDAIYDEFTELIELTDHLLLLSDVISKTFNQSGKIPVSYTHLTLPTT